MDMYTLRINVSFHLFGRYCQGVGRSLLLGIFAFNFHIDMNWNSFNWAVVDR
jgi:hypothetical protein